MTGLAFKVERDTLADAAALVARVAGRPGTFAAGVRLALTADKLSLSATDLDTWAQTTVAVTGGADGVAVVGARRLAEMAKALRPGAVDVALDGAALRLASGKSRAALPTLRAEDFPRLPEPVEGEAVDGRALWAALAQVTPAASKDQSRPILTAVLFEAEADGLRLTATDSYRLHLTTLACDWRGGPALVTAMALRELLRLPEATTVMVARGDNDVSFGVGETTITARLVEGEFPSTQPLVDRAHKGQLQLEVDREAALDVVKRAMVAGDDKGTLVCSLSPRALAVSCRHDEEDMGDETEAGWDGPDLTIAFQAPFVVDAFGAATAERVALRITDALRPVMVRSSPADEFLALLVPTRLT